MIIAVAGHTLPNIDEADLTSLAYDWLLDEAPSAILTGLGLGWGQAVARAALAHGIPVIARLAHMGQADRWSKRQNEDYSALLQQCRIELLHPAIPDSEEAAAGLISVCRESMVNECDLVLAFWDGSECDAADFVRAAEDRLIDVENLFSKS